MIAAIVLVVLAGAGVGGLVFLIGWAERRRGCYIHGHGPCRVRTGWCPSR